MEYLANLSYHKDPEAFRIGEEPSRAYFIPFSNKADAALPRACSDRFYSLCGDWLFSYRSSLYDMEKFYECDFDCASFETVSVPECWQLHGADRAAYLTSPYPIPFEPPFVPEENPCAAYVKDFDFDPKPDRRYELHFEGKDSGVYVWLNGSFVGYGECPHCDSIFDVTPYLKSGQNRLCVLVMKWCSGTYLDDQDKIRLSGLFREVYLLERAKNGVSDFSVQTKVDGTLRVKATANAPVSVSVMRDGKVLCEAVMSDGEALLTVDTPRLWSAESPELYELILACDGEYICHRFGFREVYVKNSVFYVNGKPVKLYGVNRHDSNPDTGYVTSYEYMRSELCLMKRHNVNAIRTSHYPNDPRFYELCDELGFYVMSEADMECHGCTYVKDFEAVVGSPVFAAAIHDRTVRMVEAFKNFSCVCIWSLGNESSWGCNLKNEAAYVKSYDPDRPLHYEGWRGGDGDAGDKTNLTPEDWEFVKRSFDFKSAMYPAFEKMKDGFGNGHDIFAYVMCEYSHAMGNSCGDLRFYDEIIQSDERYAGGFIWEWCDHAVTLKENGAAYFGYGGDFGEKQHFRNICMDGTVTPSREPHSNLLEAKAVFAPVRVSRSENGTLTVTNRHAFTDLDAYDVLWRVVTDGRETAGGALSVVCAPYETVTLADPSYGMSGRDAVLYVSVLTAKDTPWAARGHAVAEFSYALPSVAEQAQEASDPPRLTETHNTVTVSGKDFSYTFRKDTGLLGSMLVDGKELLASPMALTCFRAPTDNDNTMQVKRNVYLLWHMTTNFGNIEYASAYVSGLTCHVEEKAAVIVGKLWFGVPGRMPVFSGTISYRIDGNGGLTLTQQGSVNELLPYWLPRYGCVLDFAEPLENISYFGYGPAETYEDKCSHALLGRYAYTPDDPYGAYEKPQENGSHCHTQWLCAHTQGQGLRFEGDFSFCATRMDMHEMTEAKHRKDLHRLDGMHLYLDHRMSGVGSASCGGQHPVPACRIEPGETVDFAITIRPII